MYKKVKKEVRPCVRCKVNYNISNRTKWLCLDCEKEIIKERRGDLQSLFLEIWSERPHICTKCKKNLGNEPKAIYFSHIKSRGAHIELKMDKDNIELLCDKCHYEWDFGKRKD